MNEDKLNQDIPMPESLVEVTRGSVTESRHRGHVVVVDGDGRIVAQLGAPETVTFLRSASKPQQAIPLVASGAAARFGFDDAEIALACGSHNGEPMHTKNVRSMLRKIKLDERALKCGAHEPYGEEAAAELRAKGEPPGALHNNCSGKHAGMLALALHLGAPVESYTEASSPVQLEIGKTIAQFADIPVEDMAVGLDGCGVPTFGVTVRAMALSAVRLVAPLEAWDAATREACRRVVSAMCERPEMVEGVGQLDTELMRRTKGRVVSKVGAEGVYTAAVAPCAEWPRGVGLAFKLEDGDKGSRARSPVAIECLRQLGLLTDADVHALSKFAGSIIINRRGDKIGEVRASFELKRVG